MCNALKNWKIVVKGSLIVQALWLSACDPIMFYEIRNNTGEDVVVQLISEYGKHGDNPYEYLYEYIQDGDSKRIVWPQVYSHGLEIVFPEITWRYNGISPKTILFPYMVTHLQVQPDGKMYVFTGRTLPDTIDETTSQPKGYPRRPVIINQGLFSEHEKALNE